jgi:hypothetical protein
VVEHLAATLDEAGVAARIEDATSGPPAAIAVAVTDDGLLDPATVTAWDAVVATALRRSRRQRAEGIEGDVTVTLQLPDGLAVVVPPHAGEAQTGPLLTAVARGRVDGTVRDGTWWWDPGTLRLERAG